MELTMIMNFECSEERLYYATYPTALGTILLVGTESAIVALHFLQGTLQEHLTMIQQEVGKYPIHSSRIIVEHWQRIINRKRCTLALHGTPFQQKVWKALTAIPQGCSISYQELAEQLQIPQSTRAVASAIANNSIAYLIPCHRVIRHDGGLGGYRWGLSLKETLIVMEMKDPNGHIWKQLIV